jgi:hypothetical protein
MAFVHSRGFEFPQPGRFEKSADGFCDEEELFIKTVFELATTYEQRMKNLKMKASA